MEKLSKYDYVIVGAGLAGLYSAWLASKHSKVALITKSTLELSNSYWAQGGIAAAIGKDDSPQLHFEDTISAGRRLCSPEAVEILVNEGKDRVIELIEMGMPFDKKNGNIAMGLEGGHSRRRVLHSGGDATGKELVNFISKFIVGNKNIILYENTFIYNLLVSGGKSFGAAAYDWLNKKSFTLYGGTTILASGGASAIYRRTTNPYTATGEAITLAYDSGAEIESMEFIQFHPTSFYSDTGETFLISEAVRGEGAYLVNHNGQRFLMDKQIDAELSPRDIVTEEIFNELKRTNTNNVFLDLRHLDSKKIISRFSNIYSESLNYGIDITKDLVPVAPAAHYMIGGIKTDLNGKTNIENLYAVGESSSTGVHGANRLASNSLLECLVFANRAVGHSSKNKFEDTSYFKDQPELIIDRQNEFLLQTERNKIARLLWNNAGIVRNKSSLLEALDKLEHLQKEYENHNYEYFLFSIRNLVEVSLLIVKAALIREETRGCNIREDFPNEDDNLRFRITLKK